MNLMYLTALRLYFSNIGSTNLTRKLAKQGIKIPLRNERSTCNRGLLREKITHKEKTASNISAENGHVC